MGGGFGELYAARGLAGVPVSARVIDKRMLVFERSASVPLAIASLKYEKERGSDEAVRSPSLEQVVISIASILLKS